MTVQELIRECKQQGVRDIDIWMYSFGGKTWFGRWWVGTRTIYRLYDGSFEADPFSNITAERMETWGDWWNEFKRVNGYNHNRDIASWRIHY